MVGGGAGRQPLQIIVSGDVLPQQFPRFGMLYRLALKVHPPLFIVFILHGDAVAVTEMADFGQPAAPVVLPALRLFIIHRSVCQPA